jgi:hypothetical protein
LIGICNRQQYHAFGITLANTAALVKFSTCPTATKYRNDAVPLPRAIVPEKQESKGSHPGQITTTAGWGYSNLPEYSA